jgi:preprotein translocase subunit SecA
MAGRGVDIILGGNPPTPADTEKVKNAGGLHVVGTERHDSRRIDNQLRGRAGRQGDAGSSQFFLSLEDDLMRIFGGDRIKRLMETLKVPENMPIQAGMINRAISQAQAKVEGMNFDARKHLLEYDDVLNKQRLAIYRKRQELLEAGRVVLNTKKKLEPSEGIEESALDEEKAKEQEHTFAPTVLPFVLSALDMFWMSHLENMEALADAVRLRAYGQHDPLVEYRREGHLLFQQLLQDFGNWIHENNERLLKEISNSQFPISKQSAIENSKLKIVNSSNFPSVKIGRNDPCPCGAVNPETGHVYKYKKCGLVNAPYHKK